MLELLEFWESDPAAKDGCAPYKRREGSTIHTARLAMGIFENYDATKKSNGLPVCCR